MSKTTSNKFSPEVRERAVRLMQEHQGADINVYTVNGVSPA